MINEELWVDSGVLASPVKSYSQTRAIDAIIKTVFINK